jgi:FAD/FMN-containing dehydrogenase
VSASAAAEAPAVDAEPVADVAPATPAEEPPVAEVAAPNNAPHTVRAGGHALSLSARPATSIVLALGMLGTGVAIVKVRRASPVHVR